MNPTNQLQETKMEDDVIHQILVQNTETLPQAPAAVQQVNFTYQQQENAIITPILQPASKPSSTNGEKTIPMAKDLSIENTYKNSVYHILIKTLEGQHLLDVYKFISNKDNIQWVKEKKYLFNIQRVADLIIFDEFFRIGRKFSITNTRLEELAEEAIKLFNSDVYKIYKSDFYKKYPGKNPEGELVTAYQRLRYDGVLLRIINSDTPNCKKRARSVDEADNSNSTKLQKISEMTVVDPEEWSKCPAIEKKMFYEKNNFNDICTKLGILKDSLGYTLLNQDYCALATKDCTINCQKNLLDLTKKIIKFCLKEKIDPSIKHIITEDVKLKLKEESMNNESVSAIGLILLVHLGKRSIRRKSTINPEVVWSPTKPELQEMLINHVQNNEDLVLLMTKKRTEAENIKNEFKVDACPYIVLIGESLEKIARVVVVTESSTYHVSTVAEALKTVFQIHKLLNKNFPEMIKNTWGILSFAVFAGPETDLSKTSTALLRKIDLQ